MAVKIPFEAALDDRSATAVSSRVERIFADAGKDAGRQFSKQFGATAQSVDAEMQKIGDKAKDAYDKASDAAGKLRAEEAKLKDLRDRGARDSQIVSQAERLEAARRAETRAIRDATNALKDYEQASQGAGARGGQGFLDGLRSGVGGAGASGSDMAEEFAGGFAGSSALLRLGAAGGPIGLALAGVATIGVIAGRQLGQAVADGMATIQLQDQFQAAMGLSESSMAQYAAAAGSAFANNFGASVADNLGAAQTALQSGLIDTTATEGEVQTVIQQLQGMAGVTGATTQELSRSIATLMRTGMAESVSGAADIITAGFQQGLNVSGDWLDTINEYSTQFRKLGLDAGQVLTLLQQGMQGGARDTDKVADSLKEFSIRAVDGSKSTREGFEALGFNADEMGRRFAAGGQSAQVALGSVLTAIQSVDDPMQQALIWQRLFGTQFEDMGDAINQFDLSSVGAEFTNLQGVSDNATKTAAGNFASEWETATRAVGQYFSDLKTDIADWFSSLPLIKDIPNLITEAFNGRPGIQASAPSNPNNVPSAPAVPVTPGGLPGAITGGGGAASSPNSLGDLLMPSGNTPIPAAPAPDAPVPGARTPILTDAQAEAQKEAEKAATTLPEAPSLPLQYTNTAGLPTAVANAQIRLDETRHAVAEKEARLNQLMQTNAVDASVIQKARNDVAKAEQDQMQAEQALTDSRISATEKANKQLTSLSNDMSELGNSLDADFGLSKGLGGVIENAVKALGNALTAPFLAALGMVEKANPYEGSGLMGIMAANGVFGSQYTPATLAAAAQTSGGYGAPGQQFVPGMPTTAVPQSGFSDANLKPNAAMLNDIIPAMFPGITDIGGYRASDPYPDHPSGRALDIMIPNWDTPQGKAYGDQINQFLQQNADALGIDSTIWRQQYQPAGGVPSLMEDRGSANENHMNHIHALTSPTTSPYAGGGVPTPAVPVGQYAAPPAAGPGWQGPLPSGVPTSGSMLPGAGAPQAAQFGGPQGPGVGGGVAYPSQGGSSGNLVGGLALDGALAAAGAADLLMPGAGAAAKIGIQLANRTVGYAAQNAGILGSGLLETFGQIGDNPKGTLGASWLGKGLGGLAGAAAALPNVAGKAVQPPGNGQGQPNGQGGNVTNQTVNVTNNKQTEDQTGGVVAEHLSAMQAPVGRQ
ncbi:phage tail tape measure protein [Mycolicibacterium bacteremicum]|uniref:Uncharacterized protein n=1 Tax=Mycolicibacterium bacteremicum TaxID=564198 RepID=A0A1W9Z0T1_MYCBA|nr:phage tail tape measure protein [Mycolicibacterium bacteremicum]MCV7434811.1 phage tail tape measure protein [Mycolicibacterium bacteremicum]ORA05799.1 hypothetical protein BST17_08575 [Mycolicibacterium bacteremicum]